MRPTTTPQEPPVLESPFEYSHAQDQSDHGEVQHDFQHEYRFSLAVGSRDTWVQAGDRPPSEESYSAYLTVVEPTLSVSCHDGDPIIREV